MALTYSQWLQAKGLKSSPANAAAWKASGHYASPLSPAANREAYNTGARAPQGAAPAPSPAAQAAAQQQGAAQQSSTLPRPAFVPGVLDPDTIAAITSRTGQRDLRWGALDQNKETALSRINQNRLGAQFGRDKGFRNVNAGHAARGTLRSGLREVDRGEVDAEYARTANALDTDAKDVANRWQQERDAEGGQYDIDIANMRRESENARWRRYLEQFGG